VSSTYGLFHIFIGRTAVSKVYGLTYKAVHIENTDGMQLYECFLVAFMLITDDCRLMANTKHVTVTWPEAAVMLSSFVVLITLILL
jgi:hypothetical protein